MGTKKKPGKVAARGKRSSPRPTPPPFANASRARARGAAPKPAPPAAPAAPAEPPKIGRPSIKTPEVLDRICEWIANGQTLRSFCRLPGSPSFVAVYEWKDADPEFKARYERAREIGAALLHEEILDIANNTHQGKTVTTETVTAKDEDGNVVPATKRTVKREDLLGHRKLQIHAREQLLAIWFPKNYGKKVGVEHTGTVSFDKALLQAMEEKPATEDADEGEGGDG